MYWQDDQQDEDSFIVADHVVDIHYRIHAAPLPVDHSWLLFDAISRHLPWLEAEPLAGIHGIYVGESGNGWERPRQQDALIYPSRRSPLVLRIPKPRIDDAMELNGKELKLPSGPIQVLSAKIRPLHKTTSLHARQLVYPQAADEDAFLQQATEELREKTIRVKKLLCGRQHWINNGQQRLQARSLMLAGLSLEDAVRLQELGLGPFRHLGCGLFIPSKPV